MGVMLDNSISNTNTEKAPMSSTSQNKMLRGKFTLASFQYEKTEEVRGMESFSSGSIRKAQTVYLFVLLQHEHNVGLSTVCGSYTS